MCSRERRRGLALLERSEAEAAMQAGTLVIWDTPPLPCDLSAVYVRHLTSVGLPRRRQHQLRLDD
jgi:hypothetical protein